MSGTWVDIIDSAPARSLLFFVVDSVDSAPARSLLFFVVDSVCLSVFVAQLVNATVHATGTGGQTTLRFSSGDVWFAY